jgi:hypothetical protein
MKIDSITHLQRSIADITAPFAALDTDVRRKVEKWQRELTAGMGAFGKAGPEIGRVLAEARTVLKPLRMWMAFLARVPGMSARTADRFIGRWEGAAHHLPPTILALAVTSGVDMGGDERKPYGRYTAAVKRVGPPPRGDNAERAREWFAAVLAAGKRKRPVATPPLDRATDTLVRLARSESPDDTTVQVQFVSTVLKRVLRELGYRETLTVRSSREVAA